jgi:hypothetical protein
MALSVKKRIDDEIFISVTRQSLTMANAATKLGLHFNSFKRRAVELNCYVPNQSGKGITRKVEPKTQLSEILEGKHSHFQTFKLKKKLLSAKIKHEKCEICGIVNWNGKKLNFELDHIDGNPRNHVLNNLRILCPNCHSQTDTYRSKNRASKI